MSNSATDPVDLRSDTVTTPCAAMRRAIADCEVGDDVIDVDPTVDALQRRTAEMLGKEAAIFMPSGTMTNQIAVRIHCKPGDDFICESNCHIFNYEQGAFAQLSGVVARPVMGDNGRLAVDQLRGMPRPINEHLTRTRLVCLENTHNRAGGRVQSADQVNAICQWAHDAGLRTHLDGARLFNAAAATGCSVAELASGFDTVSVCFSKGLGAPVGSALAGPKALIDEARFHRKLFGGGMRQGGVLAAGALFALENNVERLADDHEHAKILAASIERAPGLSLAAAPESNIVLFNIDPSLGSAPEFAATLHDHGVWMLSLGPTQVRAVTHLNVTAEAVARGAAVLEQVAQGVSEGSLALSPAGAAY